MARPSKYQTHVESRFSDIKKWCKRGATDKEIAKALGVAESTFSEYKNQFPELKELLKKNRVDAVEEIKAAMYKKAIGFQYQEKKVINGVDVDGNEFKRTETTTKTALPDVAAGLVLLKHWDREPDGSSKWTNDPASLALKKEELKMKKEQIDNENW